MAYEARPGSLSLFKNDRKEKDSHPDYAGDGMDLQGNAVWVNAWVKETREGKKFFSISLKAKEARPAPADSFPRGGGSSGGFSGSGDRQGFGRSELDLDDRDIPFVTRDGLR